MGTDTAAKPNTFATSATLLGLADFSRAFNSFTGSKLVSRG